MQHAQRLSRVAGLAPAVPVILGALAAIPAQGLAVYLPQSLFISAVAGAFMLLFLMGAGLLTWAVYSLVSAAMGNVVGAFAGALAIASAGHLYQYVTRRPTVLVQIPGLITLVPGSMGFRGLHELMVLDSVVGIKLITDMILTGAVLAVGLLLADNIAPG